MSANRVSRPKNPNRRQPNIGGALAKARGISLLIEPLTRAHQRKLVDCGDEEVTRFLREKSWQDQERDLSRTLVLVDVKTDAQRIVGYHTLVMTQVRQEEIPHDKPLIKRAIPVILLGQIGIDLTFQGQGGFIVNG